MTVSPKNDVIDAVLGLDPSSPVQALRERREKLKHFTQTSHDRRFSPPNQVIFLRHEGGSRGAHRRPLESGRAPGPLQGAARGEGIDTRPSSIADRPSGPRATSGSQRMLAHVDLVTLKPKEATRANIEALYAVGLDDRDIVTLAGLIAFVNYQVLVVARPQDAEGQLTCRKPYTNSPWSRSTGSPMSNL